MKKNISWESLVTIIISVSILGIIFVSLYKILEYNSNIDRNFQAFNYVNVLEQNTSNIISKIDTSFLSEWEIFYLYQTGANIEIKTWESNDMYRYINHKGEWIENTLQSQSQIYSRFCFIERDTAEWQSIKCSVKELIKK